MEINRHNYEAFLLDQLEGRLSGDDQQRLHDFLLLNPDCSIGMMDGDSWLLEGEHVQLPDRAILKKEIPDDSSLLTDYNFDLFSIARMEGDLTDEQEETYRALIENDVLKSLEWKEWQYTRLVPGPVLYRDKNLLYHAKNSGRRTLWISVVSVAAAIAMVFVLFRLGPSLPQQELSQEMLPETVSGTDPETPLVMEDEPVMDEGPFSEEVEAEDAVSVKKSEKTGLFSVKRERELPADSGSKAMMTPRDDLKPRPIRFAVNNPRTSLPVGEAVPDRIEALDIQPVPIHLSSLSIAQLSELDLREMVDEYAAEKDLSIWTFANAGIKGINKIAGSDISLLAARDEDGEVSGFRFKSRRLSIMRPLGREE